MPTTSLKSPRMYEPAQSGDSFESGRPCWFGTSQRDTMISSRGDVAFAPVT